MKKIKIEGMMCGHCVKAVTEVLNSIEGTSSVEVVLENKEAMVKGTASSEELKSAIEKEGYTVVSIEDIEENCSKENKEEKKGGVFSKLFKKNR